MNIRTAILKAAEHIEKHPESYSFHRCSVPSAMTGETTACAIGWIAYFADVGQQGRYVCSACEAVLGTTDWKFYEKLRLLSDSEDCSYTHDHEVCARTLRRYADEFHPEVA